MAFHCSCFVWLGDKNSFNPQDRRNIPLIIFLQAVILDINQ